MISLYRGVVQSEVFRNILFPFWHEEMRPFISILPKTPSLGGMEPGGQNQIAKYFWWQKYSCFL